MLDHEPPSLPPQPIQLGEVAFDGGVITVDQKPRAKTGNVIVMAGGRDEIEAWARRVKFDRWSWVYKPLVWLLKRTKIRFVMISFPNRIGHLVSEMDLFLKQQALGDGEKITPILLLRSDLSANPAVLDHFKRITRVWTSAWTWRLLSPLLRHPALYHFVGEAQYRLRDKDNRPVPARWGDRPPLAELDPKIREKGRAWLESLGVPRDAWFVSLHVRTAGYSPVDERIQRFRNANIDNFKLAVDAITERGGYVIRLGDPTMRPMKTDNPRLIDVARIENREPWTDLFLCAENRFFYGTTSGLFFLAKMFGKPCASSNMIPYGVVLGQTKYDITIPKIIMTPLRQPMRFQTVFSSGASRMHSFYDYMNNNLSCVQNTPEQLRDLAVEMIERIDGRFQLTEEDQRLQERFKSLIGPAEDCFSHEGRIGRDFLREHRDLL